MQSLDEGLVKESKATISDLERQVEDLNRQYDQIGGTGAKAQADAADILTRRTQIEDKITSLQRAIEQSTLATSAAISSTHVLDAVRAVPSSRLKAVVRIVASGVIGGLAVGMGFVVLRALTSDKLRRREEVALALGAPVRFSVPSPGPASSRRGRMVRAVRGLLPARVSKRQGTWRGTDLETLVVGLESTLDRSAGGRGTCPADVRPRGRAAAREVRSIRNRSEVGIDGSARQRGVERGSLREWRAVGWAGPGGHRQRVRGGGSRQDSG